MNEVEMKQKLTWLARLGYGSRGAVYLVIGGLALMTAFGNGSKTTDSKGALMQILEQPFGNVMLVILIIGLLGYVVWRLFQATKDPDNHGTSGKGLAIRIGLFASSVTHAALAIWAIRVLMGSGSSESGSGSAQGWLTSDWGQYVLAAVGVGFVIAGLAHIYKGWKARFNKYMSIPARHQSWAQPTCRFGLIARGVVWCIVAWFLIHSAVVARSGEVKGMDDALAALRDSAYGPWLLGIVAAGLFAFGVYSVLEALYRRIQTTG